MRGLLLESLLQGKLYQGHLRILVLVSAALAIERLKRAEGILCVSWQCRHPQDLLR